MFFMDFSYDYLGTEEALDLFLTGFADGTFPKARWNHAAHVTMAACYLQKYSRPEATSRIRSGIISYNESQGGKNTPDSGYHETLTLFWTALVVDFLAKCDCSLSRLEKARAVVEAFAPRRDVFREYYSFDVVRSREARRTWVEPDVKPLPGANELLVTPVSSLDTHSPEPAPAANQG
jgi:hypothetical protein